MDKAMTKAQCRGCGSPLTEIFCDLGQSPLANSYLDPAAITQHEASFPLCAYACTQCWLVQLPAHEKPDEIFSDYAYFTSYSSTAVAHAADYCSEFRSAESLSPQSLVVEIASNDGYLLRNFVREGIPAIGIEPATNVAESARAEGIPTESFFFGKVTATDFVSRHGHAELVAANNVLAHVPDINDFVAGIASLLAPNGLCTIEFPHLMSTIAGLQFDAIYHEHYSYLSGIALQPVLARAGLHLVDVQRLPMHGGSLRLHVAHQSCTQRKVSPRVTELLQEERAAGLDNLETLRGFNNDVQQLREQIQALLERFRSEGKRVAGYGAPAKAATLTNFCGITPELCRYTVDANPEKQQKLIPGSHLPIHEPDQLFDDKPDVIIIYPWNIAEEIVRILDARVTWDCAYYVLIPRPLQINTGTPA